MEIDNIINDYSLRELQIISSRILSDHESTNNFIKQFKADHDSHQFYKNVIKWYIEKYKRFPESENKIGPTKDNTFCFYPFYALAMKQFENNKLKRVAPCCKMHNNEKSMLTKEEIGSLTPLEIFEHKKFEKLRNDSLNNIRNENCSICWDQENRGLLSYRMKSSWIFDDDFKKDLREFDVSFSNKCNLICRMCNLGGSHQFYKDLNFFKKNDMLSEVEKSTSGTTFPTINIDTENNVQLNWLLKNYECIKFLKVSGGEPLYDKKVVKLINLLVENDYAKDVMLQFHTNATLLDDKNIELLNNFKLQMHVFSVDGTNKIYNYIRHNSSFGLIENNIVNWLSKSNNIKSVAFNLVLSALNVLDLKNYFEWINNTFSYKHKIKIHISEIRPFTRGTSLYNVPVNVLELAKERVTQFTQNNQNNLLRYEIENISKLIDLGIHKNTFDKNASMLKSEITSFDKSRNQSYKDFLDPVLIDVLEKI